MSALGGLVPVVLALEVSVLALISVRDRLPALELDHSRYSRVPKEQGRSKRR